jgi:hypothetical protein
VCVILGAVLHFMDADAARAVTAGYARLMATGSCLAVFAASTSPAILARPPRPPRRPGVFQGRGQVAG